MILSLQLVTLLSFFFIYSRIPPVSLVVLRLSDFHLLHRSFLSCFFSCLFTSLFSFSPYSSVHLPSLSLLQSYFNYSFSVVTFLLPLLSLIVAPHLSILLLFFISPSVQSSFVHSTAVPFFFLHFFKCTSSLLTSLYCSSLFTLSKIFF